MRLGEAYLRLHQRAKAYDALDRAIEMSPTPGIWTRVGWILANTGADLDRAKELAMQTEKHAAALTQNLDTKSIDEDRLDLMERLAWSWDTLGQVAYRKGQFEDAERYVRAAWLLGGSPSMAYHLGRVLEERDRMADALTFYLTAHSLWSAPPPAVVDDVKRLAGNADVAALLKSAKLMARKDRLVPLPTKGPVGKAEFLAIVGSDRRAFDVTFMDGEEALRQLEAALRELEYPVQFPTASPIRVALSLRAVCDRVHGCAVLIAFPEDVKKLPSARLDAR